MVVLQVGSLTTNMNMIESRKLGRLSIPEDLYYSFAKYVYVAAGVIPLEIDYSYASRRFDISAYSEQFRQVEEGEILPSYRVIVQKEDNEIVEISVEEDKTGMFNIEYKED